MNCAVCRRPLPADTDRYACHACHHHLRYELGQLAAIELPALRAELAPGNSPQTGSRFGGRAHAPLPVNVRVLDLLGPGTPNVLPDPHGEQTAGIPIGPILAGWAHTIALEHQVAYRRAGTTYLVPCERAVPRTGSGLDAWARWLLAYLPYAVTRPWVTELHAELDDLMFRVRQITGLRPRSHPRLAPCPYCDAFAVTHTDGRWDLDCQACGRKLDPDEYAAHAAAVLPPLTRTVVLMAAAEIEQRAS